MLSDRVVDHGRPTGSDSGGARRARRRASAGGAVQAGVVTIVVAVIGVELVVVVPATKALVIDVSSTRMITSRGRRRGRWCWGIRVRVSIVVSIPARRGRRWRSKVLHGHHANADQVPKARKHLRRGLNGVWYSRFLDEDAPLSRDEARVKAPSLDEDLPVIIIRHPRRPNELSHGASWAEDDVGDPCVSGMQGQTAQPH